MQKLSSKSPRLSDSTPNSNQLKVTPFVRAFLKRVQNTVAKHRLWSKEESFIIGVSGGPDSLCLLDVFYLLSQKYDFVLHVAHVNYGLRGKNADLDETLVRERVAQYGLTLSVLHPKKIPKTNLEERLRDIRYRFFEKVRAQKKAALIAVAHHQDDQAETFLLRLLRGSGMRGLSAMQPKNGAIIRPLINTTRADILRYLKERQLSYRTDESNHASVFLRNRLRNQLIPLIEKEYQPKIKQILAETAMLLAADYQFFEKQFSLPHTVSGTDLLFSVRTLQQFDEAHLRSQFRLLIQPIYKKKAPPKSVTDELLKVIWSTKNKSQRLTFHGLKVERKGDTVRLLDFQM